MNPQLQKKLRYTLFAVIIAFLFIMSFFSTQTDKLTSFSASKLNEGWDIRVDSDFVGTVNLPRVIEAEKNSIVSASRLLTADFNQPQTILIRGSLQNVIVKLNDSIIYEKSFEDNIFNTYASIYHFVDIPEASSGSTIEIILVSPYKNMSGTLNEIHYGPPSTIYQHLMSQHAYKLNVSLLMILISFMFALINLIFFNKQSQHNAYLGIFGIFISLWLLAESRILQLYINNDFLIGSLAYVSLAASPIAATAFLKTYIFKADKKLFSSLCVIYVINLVFIITSHISGLFAFFETVTITIVLISIGFLLTLYSLIREYSHRKDILSRNYLLLFSFFTVFLLLEVIGFANKNFTGTANYATSGILLMLIIAFISTILTLSNKIKEVYEKEIYEVIANTDQLTKAKSRFAFEKDIEKLFYNSTNHLALIYFDFDDLKFINDHFGHNEGDKTLIDGFNTIHSVFHDYGNCYRIGGDEFACLSEMINLDLFKSLKTELHYKLKEINKNSNYQISISAGYTEQIHGEDQKPSDLLQRADQHMYIDKNKNKAQVKN